MSINVNVNDVINWLNKTTLNEAQAITILGAVNKALVRGLTQEVGVQGQITLEKVCDFCGRAVVPDGGKYFEDSSKPVWIHSNNVYLCHTGSDQDARVNGSYRV